MYKNNENERSGNMGFEEALYHLKNGLKLFRSGWNGKNLYVRLVKSTFVTYNDSPLLNIDPIFIIEGGEKIKSWVPSIGDLLTDDWGIIDDDC